MSESATMEILKMFVLVLGIAFLISVIVLGMQISDYNSFKQQVNYQIERNGGLTKEALANINEYSDEYYNSRFRVESDRLGEKVSYGETVDYTIIGTFDGVIMPVPEFEIPFKGTGVSQVR